MEVNEMFEKKKAWARRETELMMKTMADDVEDKSVYDDHCMAAYKGFYNFLLNTKDLERPDLVKALVSRLLDGLPLTPIEDSDDEWELFVDFIEDSPVSRSSEEDDLKLYRCKRHESLFKKVERGNVTYTDVERQVCVDINGKDTYYMLPIAKAVLDKLHPITMPYYPVGKIKIYTEDFKAYPGDYDFDTFGVLYYRLPNGQIKEVKKYFKRNPETKDLEEIDSQEYCARRKRANSLKKTEEKKIFDDERKPNK